MNRIYMDYAATTFLKEEVLDAMRPYWRECFANASSLYESGRNANRALEKARQSLAGGIGAASPKEIYFTACGTESDNWALKGVIEANREKGRHLITTAAEHHAVLHSARWLERQGYEVTVLPVDRYGRVNAQQVMDALRKDTVLVSVIYANNEVGSVNPIREIGQALDEAGVLFHTDAVQAAGHIPLRVEDCKIDLLSLSAHKFYGPKGIGILYVREGTAIRPLLHGGAQERKRRAGTENVPEIVGMAAAFQLALRNMQEENARLAALRGYMVRSIMEKVPGARFYGHPENRLPNNVSISLEGIRSQAALLDLDLAGIECSSGSACTSGAVEPSHVLLAMGVPREEASCALRFTFGETTTQEQIDIVTDRLAVLARRSGVQ